MIDITKLTNVVKKDGKLTAQCPACAAGGGDKNGEHLVVFDTGKFGCVANPGSKEHNSEIQKLVGSKSSQKLMTPVVTIKRQVIPEITVLMEIKRRAPKPPKCTETSVANQPTPTAPETPTTSPVKIQSNQQISGVIQHCSKTGATMEEGLAFLEA